MTDKTRVARKTGEVNKQNMPSSSNVIPLHRYAARYDLFLADPYERAIWCQIQARHEREKIEKAKKDTLFPTDLTDEQWLREIAMREGRDPDWVRR